MPQLHLHVDSQAGAVRTADQTSDLMEVLERSRADSVEQVEGARRPNAKGTVIEWAELIVGFSGGLPTIVGLVRAWRRTTPATRVEIELDGDRLVLEGQAPEHEQRLVDLFVKRHAGG
jgi:Effector Associated Constant Component 1